MKTSPWIICSLTLLASLVLVGRPTPVRAAENDGADRLDRLEQRVNQIAERQEQLMKRLGGQMPAPSPGGQAFHPQLPPAGPAQFTPQPNPDDGHAAKGIHDFLGLLFFIGVICNILLAIWIFTDIRKRGEGSGIFVAMALIAGIPAALIYALARIGDRKT